VILPEDAGTGVVPHRAADEASLCSRSGLPPAVISSWAAVSGPTPWAASRPGLMVCTTVVMALVR
jgi:hypothetical protein